MIARAAEVWDAATVSLLQEATASAARLGLPVYLVGGPVRDLLLGRQVLDLDLAVVGDVGPLADDLAQRLGGEVQVHDAFGTATVALPGGLHVDLARARVETYPAPGALPVVAPGGLGDDLARRDFTIHAMALNPATGEVMDPYGGRRDLHHGLVRGLHSMTFADDPTRLLRAARYAAELGFRVETVTDGWARAAVSEGALGTLAGSRLWAELQRVLAATRWVQALGLLDDWGVLRELGLGTRHRRPCLPDLAPAAAALGMADPCDLALAAMGMLASVPAGTLAGRLMMCTEARHATAAAAAWCATPPPEAFAATVGNSTIHRALGSAPPAAWLALWACHPEARAVLGRAMPWRGLSADITGDDLIAAGFEPARDFGEALRAALSTKLDHDADRERQLQVAAAVLNRLRRWQGSTRRGDL